MEPGRDKSEIRQIRIAAIPCLEAIGKYIEEDIVRQQIIASYGPAIANYVCPDSPAVELWELSFLDFDSEFFKELKFYVAVRPGYEDYAKQAYIHKSYAYPYYDPEEFRSNGGYLSWANDNARYSYYDQTGARAQSINQRVTLQLLTVFDCLIFDISSFYWLFGMHFTVYRTGAVQSLYELENQHFYFTFNQGQDVEKISVAVRALNVILGQIGGYTAIIWLLINTLCNHYESFKFTNSLIGRVYSCTPQGPSAPASTTEEESTQTIFDTLTTNCDSWYSYREYYATWLLRKVCCCCKNCLCYKQRIERYEIYLAAQRRLT